MRAGIALGSTCFVVLLAACVGGSGPLPGQGSESTDDSRSSSDGEPSVGSGSASGSMAPPTSTNPGQDTSVTIAGFDVSCEEDTDCIAVFQGAACEPCKCANAAINRKDLQNYATAFNTAVKDCSSGGGDCVSCEPSAVHCDTDTKTCAFDG
jgi:hypothetical protein